MFTTPRFLLGALLCLTLAAPAIAADKYTLDPNHTAVTFHIDHFGFSKPSGKFMNIEGTLELDAQNPAASKLNVTIPIKDINTGVAELDKHLQKPEFFDVAAFPTATFVSDKVEVTGKDAAVVHGILTIHGVAKPAALNVKLNKMGENMFKKQTAGFTATTTIKRSDFGMKTYLPGLGDEVKIDIESEANLDATPAK